MVSRCTGPLNAKSLITDAGVIETANSALSEFVRPFALSSKFSSSSSSLSTSLLHPAAFETMPSSIAAFPILLAAMSGVNIGNVRVVVLEARR